MTASRTAAVFRFAPRDTRRLLVGLALSMAVHVMLVAGLGPARRPYIPATPLQVEIRIDTAPRPAAEMPIEQAPSDTVAPAPAVTPPETVARETGPPAPARPSAPVELETLPDKYFTAKELDMRAEPVNEVDLVYPQRAFEMRLRGSVILRIFIDQRGAIDSISVLEATPPGFFEEAALTATQALQFRPAQRFGRDVKSQQTIEVVFDPYEHFRRPKTP